MAYIVIKQGNKIRNGLVHQSKEDIFWRGFLHQIKTSGIEVPDWAYNSADAARRWLKGYEEERSNQV